MNNKKDCKGLKAVTLFTVQRSSPPAPLHRRGEQGGGFFVVFCLFVGKGRKRPLLTVFDSS